jgi:hypothetical protein
MRKTQGLAFGPAAKIEHANVRALKLRDVLERLAKRGVISNTGQAHALNQMGVTTQRGGQWDATRIRRLKARLKRLKECTNKPP